MSRNAEQSAGILAAQFGEEFENTEGLAGSALHFQNAGPGDEGLQGIADGRIFRRIAGAEFGDGRLERRGGPLGRGNDVSDQIGREPLVRIFQVDVLVRAEEQRLRTGQWRACGHDEIIVQRTQMLGAEQALVASAVVPGRKAQLCIQNQSGQTGKGQIAFALQQRRGQGKSVHAEAVLQRRVGRPVQD